MNIEIGKANTEKNKMFIKLEDWKEQYVKLELYCVWSIMY